ncbi:MAG: tRNA (adenosine(37)-N6)-dimethylallyltransferase MiaA [Phycisphaerales bacterium]|nr:tRNA (adenosine(37)-N6)-dimethylallyltransferase MiaA [Phycisphaerales bacterium]
MSAPRTILIVGPTSGGKTDLGVELAQRLSGEVVTADAFQIYRGMDIGTAKPTPEERRGVPHHLLDIVDPPDSFTVHQWLALAHQSIGEIASRGCVPIVVGGTNLYVKALLDGLFEGPAPDEALRKQLRELSPEARREELLRVDPEAARRIHPNDERRTIRALEVFRQTGRPISEHQTQWDAPGHDASRLLVGLDWPTETINKRINARVRAMIECGLVDEVRGLVPSLGAQAREALGYKQVLAHLEGRMSLDDAVEKIKIETRRFAKNQRTWLKRLRLTPGSLWIDAGALPREQWGALIEQAWRR